MIDYNKKFKELPWEIRFFIEQKDSNEQIRRLEKKYKIDLKDLIYMIVARVIFIDNIEAYIKDIYGKSKKEANQISSELKNYILEPIIDYLYEESVKVDYWDNPEESADRIKKLFKNNFLDILDYYYNYRRVKAINDEIYFLLGYFDNFQKDILKILADNLEVATSQNIIIKGKIEKGTVSNWIKDFVKEVGITNINNLSISKYLVYSSNPKKISVAEKERVKKIITVYKNLKNFFDDLLGVSEGGEVEIIPFYKENKEDKTVALGNLNQEITDEERRKYHEEKSEKLEKKFKDDLEKKAIEEELLNKKDYSHLEKEKKKLEELIKKYKEGSLERKVIEEELQRLES